MVFGLGSRFDLFDFGWWREVQSMFGWIAQILDRYPFALNLSRRCCAARASGTPRLKAKRPLPKLPVLSQERSSV